MSITFIYAAVLHVCALIAVTVLVALGKISWADGGPIIGALVGIGIGAPMTVTATATKPPNA